MTSEVDNDVGLFGQWQERASGLRPETNTRARKIGTDIPRHRSSYELVVNVDINLDGLPGRWHKGGLDEANAMLLKQNHRKLRTSSRF